MTYSKKMGLRSPDYQAPYRTHPDAIPGSYVVRLQAGHTLEAHFKFLDREPEHVSLDDGTAYLALLHSGGLSDVREDSGVDSVEDNTPETGLGSEYVAPYHKYGDDAVPGKYCVLFREGHNLEKHFAFLGRRFDLEFLEHVDCYYAELDDELLAAVRRDPGVELVEQQSAG